MPVPRPYDLTLEEGDYPLWNGPPQRTIVLCSHPRSGSTMLGEALAFAGGLGAPLEYLHRGFRPTIAERWGAPDLNSYVAALHANRTEPNGVLSIKLFWQDLEDIAAERGGSGDTPLAFSPPEAMAATDYQAIYSVLKQLLPNPEFIYLERRDRVRQAVSAVVAGQTGLWRSIPDVGRQIAVAEAEFDYDRIAAAIALGDESRDHWQAFFGANRLQPYALAYEDMVDDFERVVGALLAELQATTAIPPPRRMRRQADAVSEAILLRFLREHAQRAGLAS